jgi:hypothetical protein
MAFRIRKLLEPIDLDKRLAIALLGLGLVILLLAVAINQFLIIQVAAIVILASGIHLILRKRYAAKLTDEATAASDTSSSYPRIIKLLDIAFWAMFIISLILISQQVYVRPLSFVIIVSIMAAILGAQIFTGKKISYCLLKILVIGILLRTSVWYQFPGPIGRDPILEMDYIRRLVDAGHIGDFMGGYTYYPLAHVLVASTHFLTGLPLKDSFFILGIIEVISLVFLFLLVKELFNEKIGLLSALIMAVCNWHILWGFWLKGMTLAVAWLPFLLFLLLTRRRGNRLFIFSVLSIIIIFLSVITHTVSSVAIVAIIGLFWFAYLITKILPGRENVEQPITLVISLLSLVILIGYWLYVPKQISFVGNLLVSGFNVANTTELAAIPYIEYRSPLVLTLQKLPVLILVFGAILGSLSILNVRKFDRKTLPQIWFMLVSVGMIILTFLFYFIPQLASFFPVRWFVYMSIMASVPAAVGLLSILGRGKWLNLAISFLSIFLLAGIMTTSYEANITQVVPWVQRSRDAFLTSEMAAVEKVSEMASLAPGQTPQGNTDIYTDFLYGMLLLKEFHVPEDKIIDASQMLIEKSTEYNGILLLRSAVTDTVLVSYEVGHLYATIDQSQYQSLLDDSKADLIYDNGMVKALKKTNADLPETK